jgi:hypothetical protein
MTALWAGRKKKMERPPQELDRKYELSESIGMVQKTSEQQWAWSS